MRQTILSLFIILTGFLGASSAKAVTCYAQSPVAWGVGYSYNYYTARNIALYECSVRTPYWMYCQITGCSYYLNKKNLEKGGLLKDLDLCPDKNNPEGDNFDPACPAS